MGKIVAVITVDDNICGSCPLRECNRCMYFHKQLHKNIEAGYLRCVTCKQAEVREPKAEVKEECCECGNCNGTGRIRDAMENGDWGYVDCIVCEGKGKIKQKPK